MGQRGSFEYIADLRLELRIFFVELIQQFLKLRIDLLNGFTGQAPSVQTDLAIIGNRTGLISTGDRTDVQCSPS